MYVSGADYARQLADGSLSTVKMVFNVNGAIIFPAAEQHRDQKIAGISYEDDYAGNALAAVLSNKQVEVRYHRNFSDTQVQSLIRSLGAHPDLTFIRNCRVSYQGRELSLDG